MIDSGYLGRFRLILGNLVLTKVCSPVKFFFGPIRKGQGKATKKQSVSYSAKLMKIAIRQKLQVLSGLNFFFM